MPSTAFNLVFVCFCRHSSSPSPTPFSIFVVSNEIVDVSVCLLLIWTFNISLNVPCILWNLFSDALPLYSLLVWVARTRRTQIVKMYKMCGIQVEHIVYMTKRWNMKIIIAKHKRKRNKAVLTAHTLILCQMKRIVDETLRAIRTRPTRTQTHPSATTHIAVCWLWALQTSSKHYETRER